MGFIAQIEKTEKFSRYFDVLATHTWIMDDLVDGKVFLLRPMLHL